MDPLPFYWGRPSSKLKEVLATQKIMLAIMQGRVREEPHLEGSPVESEHAKDE